MTEIIIQLIVGFILTFCTMIYLLLSKVITWRQLKDLFTPEETCGVKLYRLNNTLHIWDYKFYFVYSLPIITIIIAILLELACLISVCCWGLFDPSGIYYNILLGGIEVVNFLSLLCVADRKRWMDAKLSEPSFDELCAMTDSELHHTLVKYPRLLKNENYVQFILASRPTVNIKDLFRKED
jgi:hypothetical protein